MFHKLCKLPFMPSQTIKTPCIGLCSTVYGDLVCRGCKRYHHEVIQWNGYSAEEKHAVWLRLEQLLVQVMSSKLEVFDPQRLRQQLEDRKIRFMPQQSPYCWAYQLITRGARVMSKLDAYGLALLPEFRERPLTDLRDAIDREFFLLSEAHYERYIAPVFLRETFGPALIATL
ncbi:hypothetical protein C4J98_2379 [Pseudomonas orientalis]|nr:hypothetical protein C4J98_2379 [Pseudomonas orientalis]